MKVTNWITGIYLDQYETDLPNGTLCGFDADLGEMVAYNGKLIPKIDYVVPDPEVIDYAIRNGKREGLLYNNRIHAFSRGNGLELKNSKQYSANREWILQNIKKP